MGIELSQLPPAAQAQVLAKMAEQKKRKETAPGTIPELKKSKYGNTPAEVAGIRFDSKKEARRYAELMGRLEAGEIENLKLQEEFTLQEAYTTPAGERVRAIRYKADFTYTDTTGAKVVEDVKSKATKTKVYIIKKKLMQERFGIQIVEI